MATQPNPPVGVDPPSPGKSGAGSRPLPGKTGPGGLAGGADVGANAPGRTGKGGKQDN